MKHHSTRRIAAWIAAAGQVLMISYAFQLAHLAPMTALSMLLAGLHTSLLLLITSLTHNQDLLQSWLHTYGAQSTTTLTPFLPITATILTILEGLLALLIAVPLLLLLVSLITGLLISGFNILSLPRLLHRTYWQQQQAWHKAVRAEQMAQSPQSPRHTYSGATEPVRASRGSRRYSVWSHEAAVTDTLFGTFRPLAYAWFNASDRVQDWRITWGGLTSFCLWPLFLGLKGAGLLQLVLAYEFCIFFSALFSLVLLPYVLLASLCILFFFWGKQLYRRLYGIYLRCPHCAQEMEIPYYLCPHCRTEHANLYPNQNGLLFQRCHQCGKRLPTLKALGRERLQRYCTACHHPLDRALGHGSNIHLALLGTPGKTPSAYLLQALHALTGLQSWHNHSLHATFTNPAQEAALRVGLQRASKTHPPAHTTNQPATTDAADNEESDPTTDDAAEAEAVTSTCTLTLHVGQRHIPSILYVHNPNDQAQTTLDQDSLAASYYRYLHGLCLVIDPTQLVTASLTSTTDTRQATAALHLMQRYERGIHLLESVRGLHKSSSYPQACAVIVTHAGLPRFDRAYGHTALQAALTFNANQPIRYSERQAQHILVRKFLSTQGLDHLVRDLEAQFTNIAYFACTLDTTRQTLPTTSPLHPLQPLQWLLAHSSECL